MTLSNTTWRARAVLRQLDEYAGGAERYVDMGVRLYVVAQDDDGVEVFAGKPRVRPLRTHEFGGIWDRALGVFAGRSQNPVRWFCSEAQEPLLLHRRELAPRLLVYGSMGCLDAETFVQYEVRSKTGRRQNNKGGTIKRLYERFNGVRRRERGYYQRAQTRDSEFWVSSLDERTGKLSLNRIEGVVFSGMKECFELQTTCGRTITATADHRFWVGDGYRRLGDLAPGERVYLHTQERIREGRKPRKRRREVLVKHHPHAPEKLVDRYRYKRVAIHRAVVEAAMNGLDLCAYKRRLNEGKIDGLRFLDPSDNVHHVDGNPENNAIENLEVLPHAEHARRHGVEGQARLHYVATPATISSITSVGLRETYDICMQAPRHNFVADGFVVHNSGKTELLSMWALLRALEFASAGVFGHIGLTAPVEKRLRILIGKLRSKMPDSWYTWLERDHEFHLACNITLQLRAAKSASEETASPLQGYDWLCAGADELQDALSSDAFIESRGRAAPGGYYRRLNTVTAKDSTTWRNWRDDRRTNPLWQIEHMEGPSNPFVAAQYWRDLELSLSPRDYQRMVKALDVGPERATYPTFDRKVHLRPFPLLGARDITEDILGRGYAVLVGHDPGKIQDVSILLKPFAVPRIADPVWVVIGEVTTSGTTETHCHALAAALEPWLVDGDKCIIRCDPHGSAEDATDRDIYTVFRLAGFEIKSAAYKATARTVGPGKIKKESRIDVVNTLLLNVAKEVRLYIGVDDRGKPLAPKLVNSLEMAERDESGKAEVQRKGKADISHWGVALGYALYAYERPRLNAARKVKEAA